LVVVKGGLDSRCELARFQLLQIFDQVVVILGLDSLLELGELLVNLLDHLAGELNFVLLVEVGDVLFQNFFETNELLNLRVLPLEVHECAESPASSCLLQRKQPVF
jgi:hypothetical protein